MFPIRQFDTFHTMKSMLIAGPKSTLLAGLSITQMEIKCMETHITLINMTTRPTDQRSTLGREQKKIYTHLIMFYTHWNFNPDNADQISTERLTSQVIQSSMKQSV